jgi:peptidoglycan/xylan/chitin deacetylase (PgdA/CDA1 family)
MAKKCLKKIFLTFDDGPSWPFTLQILDILSKEGAKASFFVCGRNVQRYPEIARQIVAQGHLIGNHTFSHSRIRAYLGYWGDEIKKTNQVIAGTTGITPVFFRPPYGKITPWLKSSLSKQGLKLILWDIHGSDWRESSAQRIAQKIIKKIKANSCLLLHDGQETKDYIDRSFTVAALALLLKFFKEQGYICETLNQLEEK